MAIELGLEPLEQGQRVGRATGEARDDLAVGEPAHLARAGLQDGVLQADLAVAGDDHLRALADRQNRRAVPDRRPGSTHTSSRGPMSSDRALDGPPLRMWSTPARRSSGERRGRRRQDQPQARRSSSVLVAPTRMRRALTRPSLSRSRKAVAARTAALIRGWTSSSSERSARVCAMQIGDRRMIALPLDAVVGREVVAGREDRAGWLVHGRYLGTSRSGATESYPLQKSRPRWRLPARANGGREAPSDLTIDQ